MDAYTYLLKFLIVGNAATGKTCIMRWFLDGRFREESLHTIGVEFGTKVVQIDGKPIKLQIWDTAGQERFQCVTRSYYRGAAGALVVYDINDRDSYNAVCAWISTVRNLALPNVTILLIGNKLDLSEERRQVTEQEARQCAEENGVYAFLETSAKTGKNVHEAFMFAARGILARDAASKQSTLPFATSDPTQLSAALLHSRNHRCC